MAHDLIIVTGVDRRSSPNCFNFGTTFPSSKKRANHLYLSKPSGYSSSTGGTGHEHLLNVQVMWHTTWPLLLLYEGSGLSNGLENVQWYGAKTGNHSGSIALIPVIKNICFSNKTLYHTATVYNNMLHNEHSHSTDLILTFHIDFGGFLYVLIHYVFWLLFVQHGEGMDKHRLLKLRTLIKRNMRWGLIHKHLSSIVNHEIKLFIK